MNIILIALPIIIILGIILGIIGYFLNHALRSNITELDRQLKDALSRNHDLLYKQFDKLTFSTEQRLDKISLMVDKRLATGLDKTTETFTSIIQRLAIIDEAQKKITELSSHVVSLQSILTDKRSRGAFGEIQLVNLLRNILPENAFSLQHTLSNGNRADCVLLLPPPTGHLAIDSKFPLENFKQLINPELGEADKLLAKQRFKQDIRKHIQDINQKYIIPGETAEGAMMFIPAEAIFSEIHAYYPELVEYAHQNRVWLASPTTMMAILTTASSVIRDNATRKQVHVIQEHLRFLAKDFERFEGRMDALSKHIQQANQDVGEIQTSAKKITSRFNKIDKVELKEIENDVEII